MSDLEERELAQKGLKYIEDAIVDLLVRHEKAMPTAEIAEILGLRADLDAQQRDMIAAGILELLVQSGRIIRDERSGRYVDNPGEP